MLTDFENDIFLRHDVMILTQDLLPMKWIVFRLNQLFSFADKYRGKYSDAIAGAVCPFYCSYSGYNVSTNLHKTVEWIIWLFSDPQRPTTNFVWITTRTTKLKMFESCHPNPIQIQQLIIQTCTKWNLLHHQRRRGKWLLNLTLFLLISTT